MIKAPPTQGLPQASEPSKNMQNKISALKSKPASFHVLDNAEFTPAAPAILPPGNLASQMTTIDITKDQDHILDDKGSNIVSASQAILFAMERRARSTPAELSDQYMIADPVSIKQVDEGDHLASVGPLVQYDGAAEEETAVTTQVDEPAAEYCSRTEPIEQKGQFPLPNDTVHIKQESDGQGGEPVRIKFEKANQDADHVHIKQQNDEREDEPVLVKQENDYQNKNASLHVEHEPTLKTPVANSNSVSFISENVAVDLEKSKGGPIIEIRDEKEDNTAAILAEHETVAKKELAGSSHSSINQDLSAVLPKMLNDDAIVEIKDEDPAPTFPSFSSGESLASVEPTEFANSGQKEIIVSPNLTLTSRPPLELCEAYNNLFLIFYSMRPNISTASISIALKQCENVISVAKPIGSLPVIRPYLSSAVAQFGKQLFMAIAAEPIRWLKLSITLEFAALFKEAMIHVVGTTTIHPDGTIDLYIDIPEVVSEMITRKFLQLHDYILEVNQHLFLSSIVIDGQHAIAFSGVDRTILSTWLVVQIWRDWFCLQVSDSRFNANKMGLLYRTLGEGGDAYLTVESVRAVLERMGVPDTIDVKELQVDLELMKGFAQRTVRELCVNESMVDVQEAGIEHLTCTQMADEEVPWLGAE